MSGSGPVGSGLVGSGLVGSCLVGSCPASCAVSSTSSSLVGVDHRVLQPLVHPLVDLGMGVDRQIVELGQVGKRAGDCRYVGCFVGAARTSAGVDARCHDVLGAVEEKGVADSAGSAAELAAELAVLLAVLFLVAAF